jgi:hypothetical protein
VCCWRASRRDGGRKGRKEARFERSPASPG